MSATFDTGDRVRYVGDKSPMRAGAKGTVSHEVNSPEGWMSVRFDGVDGPRVVNPRDLELLDAPTEPESTLAPDAEVEHDPEHSVLVTYRVETNEADLGGAPEWGARYRYEQDDLTEARRDFDVRVSEMPTDPSISGVRIMEVTTTETRRVIKVESKPVELTYPITDYRLLEPGMWARVPHETWGDVEGPVYPGPGRELLVGGRRLRRQDGTKGESYNFLAWASRPDNSELEDRS